MGVDFADGFTGLGVGGSGYRAGVQDNDICGLEICRGGAAAIEELAFQGGAVGLRGAAAELLDVEGGHGAYRAHSKKIYRESTEIAKGKEKRSRRILSGSTRATGTAENRITGSIASVKALGAAVPGGGKRLAESG